MRICISGAQGVGKTTLIRALHENLNGEYKYFGRKIRKMNVPLNDEGTFISQHKISQMHIRNLKHENFISDRGMLDCMTYTQHLYSINKLTYDEFKELKELFIRYIEKYDLILYIKPEFEIEDDGFRNTNITYQHSIDSIFEALISSNFLNVKRINGSVANRVNQVEDILKGKKWDNYNLQQKLNIELPQINKIT